MTLLSTPLRAPLTLLTVVSIAALAACSSDDDKGSSGSTGGVDASAEASAQAEAGAADASAADASDASPGTTGDSCNGLCTGGGFASGKATDFGGGVIECQCGGSGAGITKSACETYCAAYKVPPAKSFVTTEKATNDKCVCDGT